ncbi:uncharacterized protein B0I36DRAFT_433085 [Microdochium trichocladiopsis]|uniref:Uncharacterized protein n=1 Tax=Microdochium trichocladiopsis TaxID=1682393 RepID=A0A9P8Y304_9PEZI|nr:uncharacterized protein B0I36DRAFT_433085 [Microdochium trichocladiopsis]KAH7027919.1 hypothetical protein B0I36DRAFT_433085 [Microdochium trichocladiopsis]
MQTPARPAAAISLPNPPIHFLADGLHAPLRMMEALGGVMDTATSEPPRIATEPLSQPWITSEAATQGKRTLEKITDPSPWDNPLDAEIKDHRSDEHKLKESNPSPLPTIVEMGEVQRPKHTGQFLQTRDYATCCSHDNYDRAAHRETAGTSANVMGSTCDARVRPVRLHSCTLKSTHDL